MQKAIAGIPIKDTVLATDDASGPKINLPPQKNFYTVQENSKLQTMKAEVSIIGCTNGSNNKQKITLQEVYHNLYNIDQAFSWW